MLYLYFFCWLITAILSLPLLVLTVECFLAFLPGRLRKFGDRPSIAVLIPAHDEALQIAETVSSVRMQLRDSDQLVVVADNCSDNTAELARDAGATVVERYDTLNRGKGFALDAGVRLLEKNPPEVVIVIDADCDLEEHAVERLAKTAADTGRVAQAVYLMRRPKDGGPESTISAFAFLVKNLVRPLGLHRLGLPVLLTGTGMAFPWPTIQSAALANGEIVEDLTLGLQLIRSGNGPILCESARVWSSLPAGKAAATRQRTRWEHGYLHTMLQIAPKMFVEALSGRIYVIPAALDMLVPPLAFLGLLCCLASGLLFAFGCFTGAWMPLATLLVLGWIAATGILVSWWRFAQDLVPLSSLVAMPNYVLSKLDIYHRFFRNRQTEWVRTERD